MYIETPSQTDDYLDTKSTPKLNSSGLGCFSKKKQEARALDGPNTNTPYLLLKFFLC